MVPTNHNPLRSPLPTSIAMLAVCRRTFAQSTITPHNLNLNLSSHRDNERPLHRRLSPRRPRTVRRPVIHLIPPLHRTNPTKPPIPPNPPLNIRTASII